MSLGIPSVWRDPSGAQEVATTGTREEFRPGGAVPGYEVAAKRTAAIPDTTRVPGYRDRLSQNRCCGKGGQFGSGGCLTPGYGTR
eukprot:147157-Rhodomonas_salina.2